MKKLKSGRILSLFSLFAVIFCKPCFANDITVNAQIPDNPPQVTLTIRAFTDGNPDNDPWTNSNEVQTINFGSLTYLLADGSNAGSFFSNTGFCVIVSTQPFGKPYEIWSRCDSIGNGLNVLEPGNFGMVPAYSSSDKFKYPDGTLHDQGDIPLGARLGDPGTAITPAGLVYSSESGEAIGRIIQVYYSIPPYKAGGGDPFPGYKPIALTQSPGQYSGLITITISQK